MYGVSSEAGYGFRVYHVELAVPCVLHHRQELRALVHAPATNAFRAAAGEQIDALTGQRTTLRNELKRTLRTGDQAAVLAVKEKIAVVSGEIKRLRESLEICDSVEQRAEQMKNELDEIQYETEKEVESDELFGRSSGTGREDVT